MPDLLFDKNIVQLRAVPDFIGYMNQSNSVSDGFTINSGRITNDHGFLNTHSFVMSSGNKLQSGNKLSNTFTTNNQYGGTYYSDFTFEARVRFTTLSANTFLFEFPGTAASSSRRYGVSSTGKMVLYSNTSPNSTQTDSEVITTNTDYHLAFCRMQGTNYPGQRLLMFINGRKVFDAATSLTMVSPSTYASPMTIGGSMYNNTNDMVGYMDDIRISSYARYTSNFTPPGNSDFVEPSNSLWLPLRPGFKSNEVDLSGLLQKTDLKLIDGYTESLNGDSVLFDIVLSKSNRFRSFYGNGTISGIAQIDGVPSAGMIIYLLHRYLKYVVRVTSSDVNGFYSFDNIQDNTNYMIVGEDDIRKSINTRRNAYIRDFVNLNTTPKFTLQNLVSTSLNLDTYSSDMVVQGSDIFERTDIFISSKKGEDPYADFVVLDLDFQGKEVDRAILDLSKKSNKLISSNTQIESIAPIYGNYSLKLSGDSSYINTINSVSDFFFSGDFTIEIDFRTTVVNKTLLDFYTNTGGAGWRLLINSSGFLYFWNNSGGVPTGLTTVANGELISAAISRTNGVIKLFRNGVLQATSTNNADFTNSQVDRLSIGGQVQARNSNFDFIGTIGKVRITNGVGRYSENYLVETPKFLSVEPDNLIFNSFVNQNTLKVKGTEVGAYKLNFKSPLVNNPLPSIDFNIQ